MACPLIESTLSSNRRKPTTYKKYPLYHTAFFFHCLLILNTQCQLNECPKYKHSRNMLKSPQSQRGESSTGMSMLMCMTKRSYCKLFVFSPFKCRLYSIADVGDKVLRFILSSHVGHWKWSAEMVVCTQTQFFSHKSFFLLIETKHKWVFGSKFYWRGRESVSAWPRDALRTEGSIYCASKWPLFLFIFYCVTKNVICLHRASRGINSLV